MTLPDLVFVSDKPSLKFYQTQKSPIPCFKCCEIDDGILPHYASKMYIHSR
jgi:hypothetical protein